MISLFRALVVAAVLLQTSVALSASGRPVKSRQPDQVVNRFWNALLKRDFEQVKKLSGFPFIWDATCRILTSFDQIPKRMKVMREIPGVRLLATTEITPKTARKLTGRTASSYIKLFEHKHGCDPATDKLKSKALRYARRYFTVNILIDPTKPHTVGKNLIPTVTRVSLINGDWKVTGFDN